MYKSKDLAHKTEDGWVCLTLNVDASLNFEIDLDNPDHTGVGIAMGWTLAECKLNAMTAIRRKDPQAVIHYISPQVIVVGKQGSNLWESSYAIVPLS